MQKPRIIELRKNILEKNDALAQGLRVRFQQAGVFVVNLVSSPGAGKTELLTQLMRKLKKRGFCPAAVTGDLATENDAKRLKASGAKAVQILTGTMCHLEADMVEKAISEFNLHELDFLFIENVGNLVCPSGFDLGEDLRIMLVSTTDGEDKPLKYPTLTNSADLVIINKIDIAAAVGCDLMLIAKNVHQIRPGIPVLSTSAKTGEGVDELVEYFVNLKK